MRQSFNFLSAVLTLCVMAVLAIAITPEEADARGIAKTRTVIGGRNFGGRFGGRGFGLGGFGLGGFGLGLFNPVVPIVQDVTPVVPIQTGGLNLRVPGVRLNIGGNRFGGERFVNHQLLLAQRGQLNALNTFGYSTNATANIAYQRQNLQFLQAPPIVAAPIYQQLSYQVPSQVVQQVIQPPPVVQQLQDPAPIQGCQAPALTAPAPVGSAYLTTPVSPVFGSYLVNPARLQFRQHMGGGHY